MGPLTGLRVIEMAGIGPAPLCAMLLADLGAEVVRVARPNEHPLMPLAPEHDVIGRSRPTLALDLKSPAGIETLLALVERCDALIEGFRPGVAERLGFGPEACHARNPRLVFGRMTGWGQEGPLAHAAGHDIDYIALTGALAGIGRAGESPVPPLNLVGDYGGGTMFLAFGVMCALWECQRSGRGQVVDAAMIDGAATLMSMFYALHAAGRWTNERQGNLLDGGAPFYDTYETSDGRHVAVGALEPRFFAELARRVGLDERFVPTQYDRATWPALRAALTDIFAARPRDEWTALLDGTDACVSPVLTMSEAPLHPHNVARGTFTRMGEAWQPSPSPRFSRTPACAPREPAATIPPSSLLARFGLAQEDIKRLQRAGAFEDDRS